MVEVVVKELVYIKDIPVEMLDDAIKAGELRKGKTVGLVVASENPGEEVLVELKIEKEGQEKLIKKDSTISIEQFGMVYKLV